MGAQPGPGPGIEAGIAVVPPPAQPEPAPVVTSSPESPTKPPTLTEQLAEIAKLPPQDRRTTLISSQDGSISSQIIQKAEEAGGFAEDGKLHTLVEDGTLARANEYHGAQPTATQAEQNATTQEQTHNLESRIHVLEAIAEGDGEEAEAARKALQMLDETGLRVYNPSEGDEGNGKTYTREDWERHLREDFVGDDAGGVKAESEGVWQFIKDKEPHTLGEALTQTIEETEAELAALPSSKENQEQREEVEGKLRLLQFAASADGELGPAVQLKVLEDVLPEEDFAAITGIEKIPTWDTISSIVGQSREVDQRVLKLIEGGKIGDILSLAQNIEALQNPYIRGLFFRSDESFAAAKTHIEKYGQKITKYYAGKSLKVSGIALLLMLLAGGTSAFRVANDNKRQY